MSAINTRGGNALAQHPSPSAGYERKLGAYFGALFGVHIFPPKKFSYNHIAKSFPSVFYFHRHKKTRDGHSLVVMYANSRGGKNLYADLRFYPYRSIMILKRLDRKKPTEKDLGCR